MGMVAVIHKKGAPDNFVWEETKVGSPSAAKYVFAARLSA